MTTQSNEQVKIDISQIKGAQPLLTSDNVSSSLSVDTSNPEKPILSISEEFKAAIPGIAGQRVDAAAFLGAIGFGAALLEQNGYIKIPNINDPSKPITVQFGSAMSNTAATFPIAFPNACVACVGAGNSYEGAAGTDTVLCFGSITKNGFASVGRNTGGSHISFNYCYIAIGW